MGRYPFEAALKPYLTVRKASWKKLTREERERKFRYLSRVFRDLKKENKIGTTNPKKMTESDILAFEEWMLDDGLDPATRAKYRCMVKDFLNWNENYVYERLIQKKYISTKQPPKPIKTLNEEEFDTLLSYAEKNRDNWTENMAYFIVGMCGYLGLRPKEIREANVEDINKHKWIFTVQHPKGEDSYGEKREIPIVAPLRPIIQEFLGVREQYLKENGILSAKPLIPSINNNNGKISVTEYSSNRFRVIARKLAQDSGIHFQVKMLRSTCGQILKDRGTSIESVSKFLGHSSTKTTEKFYCRLRDEAMFQEINSIFPQENKSAISRSIENKKDLSGYA